MIHAASGSFPSLSSPSFFCPLRLAVCTFCFVPGPVSHALDILLFNLPDTYHKIAIKNLVFLKKRGGGRSVSARMHQVVLLPNTLHRIAGVPFSLAFGNLG